MVGQWVVSSAQVSEHRRLRCVAHAQDCQLPIDWRPGSAPPSLPTDHAKKGSRAFGGSRLPHLQMQAWLPPRSGGGNKQVTDPGLPSWF